VVSNKDNVLKSPNSKTSYTEEHIMKLDRCCDPVDGPFYFINNFMKIQHPTKGVVPFEMYPFQYDIINGYNKHRFVCLLASRQVGKALALDTPILTPTGFTTMGDIKVGDTVYGQDGKKTNVTFITDVMNNRDCYEIEFSHGDKIVADTEHLWKVRLPNAETVIVNTEQMIALDSKYKKLGQGLSISTISGPVDFENNTDLDIDYYTFGLWLGDRHTAAGRITCHISDYQHYVEEISKSETDLFAGKFYVDNRRSSTGSFTVFGLMKKLRKHGILSKKNIPDSVVLSSVENRIRLIQGLMDSNGSVSERGTCFFYQSNKELTEQVRFILSTLGVKSKIRIKKN